MYRSVALLFLATLVTYALAADALDEKQLSPDGLKLVCYYSNWAVYRPGLAKFTPQNINPYLCTHVIYAFATLSSDFELAPLDPYNDIEQGNYKAFVSLKQYNPNLKTLIAVGGWDEGSKKFSKLVESDFLRQNFIKGALAFVREHGFDGLDMDWEYPAFREGGNYTDKLGYAKLIKELRQAIEAERLPPGKEKLLLTVAVPATKAYIDMGFDVPTISRNADFLNLLTYDYHSAYEPETHHHAALLHSKETDPEDDSKSLNVKWTVDYYLQLGCPREKIVVGIPMYGRSYTLSKELSQKSLMAPASGPGEEGHATREKGYLAYYEICQKVKDDDWEVDAPYPNLVGPYAFKGNQWVGFDDEEMISIKVRFILDYRLGGAMVWTLDNDDFRGICTDIQSPLVNTLRSALLFSNVIQGSSSQQSLSRSAGPQPSSILFDDDNQARSVDGQSGVPGRRRTTLRRLVQDRKSATRDRVTGRRISDDTKENTFTTPAPPPTPDPGFAFECKDEGFFNNPKDCKKYFWCLDSGPANLGVVAHAFTCPSGLFFNAGTESCDYPENVVCPGRSASTVTKAPPTRQTRPKPRATTTTTTKAPPTTPEEEYEDEDADNLPTTRLSPSSSTESGGGNVAELLRLLQAIGGVEKLQSLLGSQSLPTSLPSTVSQSIPEYAAPKRPQSESSRAVTPNFVQPQAVPTRTNPRQQNNSPDHRPQPTVPSRVVKNEEIDDKNNFRFQYQTPPRGRDTESVVEYAEVTDVGPTVDEEDDEEEDDYDTASPDGFSYGTPPGRSTTRVPFAPAKSEDRLPRTNEEPVGAQGNGYRAPIRVQVVRIPNGGNANENATGPGVRRRMRVRVRPDGERVIEEAPQAPQARAIPREEHKSAAAARAVVVRDPNPPPLNTNDAVADPRLTIRRRPIYNNIPNNTSDIEAPNSQVGNVRLVARSRRPGADALLNQVTGHGQPPPPPPPPQGTNINYLRIRGQPNSGNIGQPLQSPPQPSGVPARPASIPIRPGYQPPINRTPSVAPVIRSTIPQTTTTTTPTSTTAVPTRSTKPEHTDANGEDEEYEYDDEYEDYPEEEDTTTTSTTTTTTTTTTKPPPSSSRPPVRQLLPRRRPAIAAGTTSTTKRPTISTSVAPRRSTASTSRRQSSSSTTTKAPSLTSVDEEGVVVKSDSDVECIKRGVFIHPTDCSKFIVCAPSSRVIQGLRGRILLCPANQIYLEEVGRCMKGDRNKCEKL